MVGTPQVPPLHQAWGYGKMDRQDTGVIELNLRKGRCIYLSDPLEAQESRQGVLLCPGWRE